MHTLRLKINRVNYSPIKEYAKDRDMLISDQILKDLRDYLAGFDQNVLDGKVSSDHINMDLKHVPVELMTQICNLANFARIPIVSIVNLAIIYANKKRDVKTPLK